MVIMINLSLLYKCNFLIWHWLIEEKPINILYYMSRVKVKKKIMSLQDGLPKSRHCGWLCGVVGLLGSHTSETKGRKAGLGRDNSHCSRDPAKPWPTSSYPTSEGSGPSSLMLLSQWTQAALDRGWAWARRPYKIWLTEVLCCFCGLT